MFANIFEAISNAIQQLTIELPVLHWLEQTLNLEVSILDFHDFIGTDICDSTDPYPCNGIDPFNF
jgi:hypothetical protein